MRKRRSRCGRVALLSSVVTTLASAVAADPLAQVRLGRARDAFVVARAIDGASRRLEDARCRGMLSTFHDPDGKTLADVLAALGRSGRDHLGHLFFYSGDDRIQCRGAVLAWTEPRSRVVYVCPDRFRAAHALDPARAESVILHEMLHTLGLGEDPPTSTEITARVEAACRR